MLCILASHEFNLNLTLSPLSKGEGGNTDVRLNLSKPCSAFINPSTGSE